MYWIYWITALSYHMPLSIINGFASTGNLECVLVFELDFNVTSPQPQHEP